VFLVKRKKLPALSLVIGFVLFGVSQLIGNWYKWTPATFPINLIGLAKSEPFKINLSTRYLINLEVERLKSFESLNCLIGIHIELPDYCRTISSPVNMKWSVLSSSEKVAEGTSEQEHGGAWGSTIRRTIGRFSGEKGKTYVIQVESLEDASILAPTNPQIVIRADSQAKKDYFVFGGIVALISFLIISGSLLWLLLDAFRNNESKQ
jgi:hypothetical protein